MATYDYLKGRSRLSKPKETQKKELSLHANETTIHNYILSLNNIQDLKDLFSFILFPNIHT